jgi:hypothetical protein
MIPRTARSSPPISDARGRADGLLDPATANTSVTAAARDLAASWHAIDDPGHLARTIAHSSELSRLMLTHKRIVCTRFDPTTQSRNRYGRFRPSRVRSPPSPLNHSESSTLLVILGLPTASGTRRNEPQMSAVIRAGLATYWPRTRLPCRARARGGGGVGATLRGETISNELDLSRYPECARRSMRVCRALRPAIVSKPARGAR